MRIEVQQQEGFSVAWSEERQSEDVTILHLVADADNRAEKLSLVVRWQIENIGIHTTWSPGNYKNKEIVPEWGSMETSCAMSQAPVFADVSYDDKNRQTIACADGKNQVQMHTGVIEETGCLDCVVCMKVEYPVTHYETDIRIDRRDIPFTEALEDVSKWWATYPGYLPVEVPLQAYEPVYSTWYSFHQEVDVDEIVRECRYFSRLGCKTLIVDDGWQTDRVSRSYAWCGDWQPVSSKIPDMKEFVKAVHDTGMKFLLWYSVPFVGDKSEVYQQFKDHMLCLDRTDADGNTYVVDPRYPKVREYLIELYRQAVLQWDLDGFKLDFVDSFRPSDIVKEGMDYVSVYDAVDRLLKDVIQTLREIKPDILIEFRQSYMGPMMRTFGNMLRSFDCPNDSWSNGMNTLALRLTSGETAVHSDMVMWNPKECAELAAFQITRPFFAVPQISVRHQNLSEEQKMMVGYYLGLWKEHQDTLMSGTLLYKGYANNFLYVSARKNETQVGVVYGGRCAYLEQLTEQILLINSSLDSVLMVECKDMGEYTCCIRDCMGNLVRREKITIQNRMLIEEIPVNGTLTLTAVLPE